MELARQRPLGGGVRARPPRTLAVPGRRMDRPSRRRGGRAPAGSSPPAVDIAVELEIGVAPLDAVLDGEPEGGDPVPDSGGPSRDSTRCAPSSRRGDVAGCVSTTSRGDADASPAVLAHRARAAGLALLATPLDVRRRPRAGPVQRLVRVLPPLDGRTPPTGHGTLADADRPPRLRRRAGLRRRSTCRRSTRSASPSARAATTPSTADARRPRQPVGDRRRRGRPHARAPRPRHPRRRRRRSPRPPRARASSSPSTSPSSARPTTRG